MGLALGTEKTIDGAIAEPSGTGRRPALHLLAPRDVAILIGLLPLTLVAWLAPERSWPAICRFVSPFALPIFTGSPRRVASRMRATWPEVAPAGAARALLQRLAAEQIRTLLQVLRCHRPGRWRPHAELAGLDRLRAALAGGRGAVLWITYSMHCDLAVKQAFHAAGLPLTHLSRRSHGFSGSWFGRRFLNPIHTRIEDQYLGARVVLDDRDPGAVLRRLEAPLRDNRPVSVTVHKHASRPARPPFLGDRLTLAPGAVLLAYRAGAPLLPVFAFREPSGRVLVTVEPPLDLAGAASAGEAIARAAEAYARRLEPHVRRYPDQWRGWLHL